MELHLHRERLAPERQLVLLTAVEMNASQQEQLEQLLNGKLEWAEVIYQMITHRTLNMFRYNLKKFGLFEKLEQELQRLLNTQWAVFHERNNAYSRKLVDILHAFDKAGVKLAVLKGNLLAHLVYPTIETRVFNDLDFLMKLEDVNAVESTLEGLGYIQGEMDKKTGVITPATRKAKLMQQMATHEIQEFLQYNDNPFAPHVEVDVNHDILWKGNCPYKVPTRDLIERAVPVDIHGAPGYRLDTIDNIIQLSCHLYKEATLMAWIKGLKDLKIYKFADMHLYLQKYGNEIDWQLLLERVQGYGLDKVIYYNFHYCEMMFGKIVPEHVMVSLRPDDLGYLDEYAIENKEPSVWEYDFFTRLFDVNRIVGIEESQATGLNRFVGAKWT